MVLFLFEFSCIVSVFFCNLYVDGQRTVPLNPPIDRSDRFNAFDWGLSKAVGAAAAENIVLSPISVKLALALLYEGAKGNTKAQLEKALNISPQVRSFTAAKFSAILQSLEEARSGYDINIGTKLFIDHEAKPKQEFQKKIESLYNATIEKINFKKTSQAVSKINAWAKAVTNGHIQHLVSEADTRESTIMLLLNAVYFKGIWENQFPVNETKDHLFYKGNNASVKVPFMKAVHNLKYAESFELKASVLRMPYVGGKFAMYILLPFEKNGLQDVIEAVDPDKLRSVFPKMLDVPVQISLPKFHFEFASSLAPALQQMGVTDMFNSNANLNEIAEGPKELVVSNVIQKAGINVNEQGSTAYATTVVDLTSKFGEHAVEFTASHPFLFFIEDETTDTVVFVGKVIDPAGFGKPKVEVQPLTSPQVNGNGVLNRGEIPTSLTDQQTFSYFDIELAQICNNNENSNWVTSPSSIKSVLGLVIEGANGNTLQQLSHMLRLPNNKTIAQQRLREFNARLQDGTDSATMKIASRILAQKDLRIKPKYRTVAANIYGVEVENVDFSTPTTVTNQINYWVNGITQGLIPSLLDPGLLTTNTSLVFLNAIYFKGDWKIPFSPAATHLSCFYTSANECKKTEFMKTTGVFKFGYISSLRARIIELLYSDPRYSLVLLLPLETNGLQQTMRNLPFNSLFSILENLSFSEISLIIPKFTIEYSVDLMPLLRQLGATDMFTDLANLEDMLSPNGKTSISGIIHKSKIDVNEKGTVAAAATAIVAETLMSKQAIEYKADHPFLFFLRDRHTGFLFEGAYVSPLISAGQMEQPATPLIIDHSVSKPSGIENSYHQTSIRNTILNRRY